MKKDKLFEEKLFLERLSFLCLLFFLKQNIACLSFSCLPKYLVRLCPNCLKYNKIRVFFQVHNTVCYASTHFSGTVLLIQIFLYVSIHNFLPPISSSLNFPTNKKKNFIFWINLFKRVEKDACTNKISIGKWQKLLLRF